MSRLQDLSNEQAVLQLTNIKGIGRWTAEMFLIFSLGRKDVLALDDVGLQRGAKWLYQVPDGERRRILAAKSKLWHGHYTIASFYLWEAVHHNLVSQPLTIEELKL
ncbi:hypothetical protein RWE15_19870 [Virgibacillus halophilus]|uniref:DNA-3-methyladenine glycosylase II n=1 Tax=Tigheibacillus halophilus TaxID=361280 RepID=A0ABU5CA60_9BACI|nr:hypothetical protein [Virgibacillus halophilus]